MIVGIRFEEIDLDKNDAVDKVMRDFDTSNDEYVDVPEFTKGISKWLLEASRYGRSGPDVFDIFHRVSCLILDFSSSSLL